VGHDVVQFPSDLRPLVGQGPADLLHLLSRGGRCLLRGSLGPLAGVHPAGPRIFPGQPAEQHQSHASDGGRDYGPANRALPGWLDRILPRLAIETTQEAAAADQEAPVNRRVPAT
jgi:hypothetical protein